MFLSWRGLLWSLQQCDGEKTLREVLQNKNITFLSSVHYSHFLPAIELSKQRNQQDKHTRQQISIARAFARSRTHPMINKEPFWADLGTVHVEALKQSYRVNRLGIKSQTGKNLHALRLAHNKWKHWLDAKTKMRNNCCNGLDFLVVTHNIRKCYKISGRPIYNICLFFLNIGRYPFLVAPI